MKMDFIDRYNFVMGLIAAVLTAVMGTYWYVFAGYLLLNVLDWLTGWYRSEKLQQASSDKGWKGILKKTGYWVIVCVAFLIPDLLIALGRDVLGLDLHFLFALGWLTLTMLIVNESRSIVENLVECGFNVPSYLVKGLQVTSDLLNARGEETIPEVKEENKDETNKQ